MNVKLLTEHHLEFLILKGGYTGSSESATLLEITCRVSNSVCSAQCSADTMHTVSILTRPRGNKTFHAQFNCMSMKFQLLMATRMLKN